jgi:N-acetyl-1-D-myo-inositol-2-amino-2-deoxy-alpha-D-glucopyranoside deacetylase
MSAGSAERRLLLVHAHPDDESIFTGATMAKYAEERARVTLVTCTRGERGLNLLASTAAGRTAFVRPGAADRDQLGDIRARELDAACAALGVKDHGFLGGPGRWRDSGPLGSPGDDPRSFCRADVNEAARELAEVINEVRPQVVVTYDAIGFYGHPDHIQAHRVAWRAYQLAAEGRAKLYAVTLPWSLLTEVVRRPGRPSDRGPDRPVAGRLGVPDEQVTTAIDASAHLPAKLAALRAHATQIAVDEPFFTVAGLADLRLLGTEYYTLLAGPDGGAGRAGRGRDDDLFTGI